MEDMLIDSHDLHVSRQIERWFELLPSPISSNKETVQIIKKQHKGDSEACQE